MCIICSNQYDINIIRLIICNQITKIPKELINLQQLNCFYTQIKKKPKN